MSAADTCFSVAASLSLQKPDAEPLSGCRAGQVEDMRALRLDDLPDASHLWLGGVEDEDVAALELLWKSSRLNSTAS